MAEKNAPDRPGEGLGRAIAARRVELGMRRKDLASGTGLSYPYISEIENGVKVPSEKALRNIADALQIDYAELIVYGEGLRELTLESEPAPTALEGLSNSAPGEDGSRSLSSDSLSRSASPSIRRLAATRRRSSAFASTLSRDDGGVGVPGKLAAVDEQAVADLIREGVRAEIDIWVSDVLPTLVTQVVEQVIAQMLESEEQAE